MVTLGAVSFSMLSGSFLPHLKGSDEWNSECTRGVKNVLAVRADTASAKGALERRVFMSALFLPPTKNRFDSEGMCPPIPHVFARRILVARPSYNKKSEHPKQCRPTTCSWLSTEKATDSTLRIPLLPLPRCFRYLVVCAGSTPQYDIRRGNNERETCTGEGTELRDSPKAGCEYSAVTRVCDTMIS